MRGSITKRTQIPRVYQLDSPCCRDVMQTLVEPHLCIPRDGTNATCEVARMNGCPLHRISRTKRNNRTYEKSLIDLMSSNSRSHSPDLREGVHEVCDVGQLDVRGGARLWHRSRSCAICVSSVVRIGARREEATWL